MKTSDEFDRMIEEIGRKEKQNMFNIRFALSYNEHMEQPVSGVYCLDALFMRSYRTKQDDFMILLP